jgi:hypothetical protein
MLPEDLLSLLHPENLIDKTYTPVSRVPQKPKKDKSYIHKKYDISHLPDLMSALKALSQDDDENENEKYGARYLVDLNKRIIFAREGCPGKHIPMHKEIAKVCVAAGTVFFNKDHSKIIKINHSSGDFHPGINSLIWPLAAILAVSPGLVNDELIVQIINEKKKIEDINVPKEKLQEILTPMREEMLNANKPWTEIKTDEFNSRLQNRINEPNPKRRCIFSDVSASSQGEYADQPNTLTFP